MAEYLGPFFSYHEFENVTLKEFAQKNSDRKMLELKQNKTKKSTKQQKSKANQDNNN